jgi:hypothetical protein
MKGYIDRRSRSLYDPNLANVTVRKENGDGIVWWIGEVAKCVQFETKSVRICRYLLCF